MPGSESKKIGRRTLNHALEKGEPPDCKSSIRTRGEVNEPPRRTHEVPEPLRKGKVLNPTGGKEKTISGPALSNCQNGLAPLVEGNKGAHFEVGKLSRPSRQGIIEEKGLQRKKSIIREKRRAFSARDLVGEIPSHTRKRGAKTSRERT